MEWVRSLERKRRLRFCKGQNMLQVSRLLLLKVKPATSLQHVVRHSHGPLLTSWFHADTNSEANIQQKVKPVATGLKILLF